MSFLEIEVACPECGGPILWLEQHRLNGCSYCGSMLYFEHNVESRFYLPPTVTTPEEIKEVLVLSKAEKKRAERMARYPTGNPESTPEMLSVFSTPLEPFLLEFRAKISLQDVRLIYAPYWHIQAILFQCLLGTNKQEVKQYFFRRAFVDETLQAYNSELWNFRDRGLRFGQARLKQVTASFLSTTPHISFDENFDSQMERVAQAHPPIEGEAYYLFKFHSLCERRRLPVFRPYWFVRYACGKTETALLDGAYSSVAGYPDIVECSRFLSYKEKPYVAAKEPEIRVISSRCPVCGADTHWAPNEAVHFCPNCGRALLLQSGEVKAISYQYLIAHFPQHVYIPFWKFRVRLFHDKKIYDSLRSYFRLFFPERLIKDKEYGDSLWIPGVSIRRERKGDQLLTALIADACSRSAQPMEGPIHPVFQVQRCELDMGGAAELLTCILPTASGISPALHKSGSLVQMLKKTQIDFGQGSLVLVPYALEGENLLAGKQRFSRNLLL